MTTRAVRAGDVAVTAGILEQVSKRVVGQDAMVERLLIGLLAGGHLLLEGVPGLAKTLAVRTLAETIRTTFQRIQFTPDLLPADVIGTMVFDQRTGEFRPKRGPLFANIILADEINRAPAKVQSALLEAMQEKQVTIGGETYPLTEPFLVLATQNPIEQEGTYPLPEAQLDRFMLKIRVGYPTRDEEKEILWRMAQGVGLHDVRPLIAYGASPRASIYLAQAARAHAYVRGRSYVVPEDVKAIAPDVLRHRVLLTFEAEAEDVTSDDIVAKILEAVDVP
jgi:MoxR-like ATPase